VTQNPPQDKLYAPVVKVGDLAEMKKHSVLVAGHATSVTLENAFWQALKEIAAEQCIALSKLITEIDQHRVGNLSSAIRVYVLETSREQATKR
jgi:predicted DNA-binding ribbon-helix-helix protein